MDNNIISDGKNRIMYSISMVGIPSYYIEEAFMNDDNDFDKTITFSKDNDYKISAFSFNNKNENILTFKFNENNILYESLSRFLDNENLIIIDSDDVKDINKKYVVFERKDDSIFVSFINKEEKTFQSDKFNIFVKNVYSDYRGKIETMNFDTKYRLYDLFESFKGKLLGYKEENIRYLKDIYGEDKVKELTKNLRPNNTRY